ncbi:MAG: DNA polymerase III subunit gamma/tau [Hyphomicrobiaceae bacterium]
MDGPSLFGDEPKVAQGYVVLARKYRPQTFEDLIGQDAMVTTLRNAFASERIAQAYMLTGVRGVGKTTTARILARALNYVGEAGGDGPSVDLSVPGQHCREIIESRHPDVIEMDAASNTGVDNIREIIESARYKPLVARYKVFIIDEVHMLSKGAFNALLKTLEEPPPHVKFIFATTEIRKVPVTVLSRCQRFDLRRVDVPVLSRHFKGIVEKEGAEAEPEALALIARAAGGSVRDGLSVLDQAIAMGSGKVTESGVREMLGLADRGRLFDLLEQVFKGDAAGALAGLAALNHDGADPIQTLADLGEGVHIATRIKVAGAEAAGEGLSGEEKRRAGALAEKLSLAVLSRAWSMLLKGHDEAGRSPNALSAAEMVLIRIAHAADLPSPEDIIRRLGSGGERRQAAPTEARSQVSRDTRGPLNEERSGEMDRSGDGSTARAGSGADHVPTRVASVVPVQAGSGLNEPPPPVSLDDYGAADMEAPDFDEEDPEVIPAVVLGFDDPRSFEEVVAVVGKRRDAKMLVHLEEHVSLIRFDPQGSIEIALLPGAPAELANDLREKAQQRGPGGAGWWRAGQDARAADRRSPPGARGRRTGSSSLRTRLWRHCCRRFPKRRSSVSGPPVSVMTAKTIPALVN